MMMVMKLHEAAPATGCGGGQTVAQHRLKMTESKGGAASPEEQEVAPPLRLGGSSS